MHYTAMRTFSSAHFYHQKNWSELRNQQEFGKCFSPHGHGHDYRLEVSIVNDPKRVLSLNQELGKIVERLDHKHLNAEIQEFADLVPTTENIGLWIKSALAASAVKTTEIKLYERPDLWVVIPG